MGWYQREQQKTKQEVRAEQQAAEQAKKDQEQAARNQLVGSWQDLYNTGGDLAVAESILSGHANGGTYTAQDIAAAKKVKEGGTTFGQIGQEAFQASYDQWNMVTGNGKNKTRYGPQAQSIYEIMPFDDWSKGVQRFEWSDGSYDDRIKSEKAAADKAAADKRVADRAAADKAAADKAAADAAAKRQADLDEAQRQKDAAAQAALQNKPKPEPTPQEATPNTPVKEETPIEEAKSRAEEYKKTTTQDGNTITNNIEQNVGNKGDMKTDIGDDNTITNSRIGDDESKNTGSINVSNQQINKDTQESQRNKAREEAKERANQHSNTVTNNIEQNVGNKGDMTTKVGDENTITNSQIGNDKSENNGNINVNTQQQQEETKAFRSDLLNRIDSLEAYNVKSAADKKAEADRVKAEKAATAKAQAQQAAADKAQAQQAAADKKKKDKDDYVWGLVNKRADAYKANANFRVTNGSTTTNNAYTVNNDFLQNTGNKGNMTTSFGNNNKLNNVRAGNDYSINLGNINSSNYSM